MLTINFMDKSGKVLPDSEVEDFVNQTIKMYFKIKKSIPDYEVHISNFLIAQSFQVAVKEGKIPAEEVCFKNGNFIAYVTPGGYLDNYSR